MAGEWKRLPLADAVDVISGGTPKTSVSEYWNGDIPWLAVADFNNGYRWVSSAEKSITERGLLESATTVLSRGDVILSARGTVGVVAQLAKPMAFNQSCYGIRGKKGVADTNFIYYALRHAVSGMKQVAHGGVFDTITRETFRIVEVNLPPLTEQRAIAHILGTLDDKIELNRRMSETLEAMARALFKAWFVDFEPVRAKMEGRWRRGESLLGLPAHLYDLFPDRLVESELGEIPEGWGVGALGDVADNPRRGIQPNSIQPDTPYIALEHMPKRCITLSDWGIAAGLESNKFEFRRGEILFGKLRPYFHKVGVAPVDGVCSTDIVVVAPKSSGWFGFVLGHVSSVEFVEYTNAGSTGTKMPRTSWAEMARYAVALPPQAVTRAFTERLQPFVAHIIAGVHESRTLAQLRDTLLPKLISGEMRVPDVDKFMEAMA
ncbi:restriction endonuclease subunit S [Deinococcus sp. DB0503]|uniref:restriction endonuclease subunit S n=1 Tax=Deinococcus sp. DB0503 TaxID=2479203 RepID=UPI0018DFB168|nr:restriction endonuclease subunit S [Deinococcus sp. DB0503]MBI0444770.1 restriction endonuclease subunit S [Deinococcus sp. DB0503]